MKTNLITKLFGRKEVQELEVTPYKTMEDFWKKLEAQEKNALYKLTLKKAEFPELISPVKLDEVNKLKMEDEAERIRKNYFLYNDFSYPDIYVIAANYSEVLGRYNAVGNQIKYLGRGNSEFLEETYSALEEGLKLAKKEIERRVELN